MIGQANGKPFISAARFALLVAVLSHCGGGVTEPRPATLPAGNWSGGGACLSVTVSACDLVVGCGHGQFPRPALRPDGTFDVDGSWQIEVGPGPLPAHAAHFSGAVNGSRLTLTVTPSGQTSSTYSLAFGAPANCAIPCV